MHDSAADDQLRDLLAEPSAETRYGAFRALTIMCPDDALVKGENLGGQFHYHVLNTQAPADDPRHDAPPSGSRALRRGPAIPHAAGHQCRQRDHDHQHRDNEISISKFAPHEADQKRVVTTRVDEVIRAVVELGGTYPDVVQAIQEAKAADCLEGRFEVDAVPEAGRSYAATLDDSVKPEERTGLPPDK